jgi:hypothetical protein
MLRFNIENSNRLRDMIEKAIEDHIITRQEYDQIIHLATEDGHIDPVEKALLSELHQMIQDKMVRFRKA